MIGEPSYSPLVSVIIPNYNHAQFLKERIDSVLNQTFNDVEVIILDDCSTDNSREIIESYRGQEKISQILFNDSNSGSPFAQWQKGLSYAKGSWIWFAESDDVAAFDFLETLMRCPGKLKYTKSRIIDKNSIPSNCYGFDSMPSGKHFAAFNDGFSMPGPSFVNQWMLRDNFIPNASAVLIETALAREVMATIGMELSTFRLIGDWVFWVECLMRTDQITYCPLPLNDFRNHEDTMRAAGLINRTLEMEGMLSALKRHKISLDSTISTLLYRYLAKESFPLFTIKDHFFVVQMAIRYRFFWLYCKSLIKSLSKR